MIKQLSTLTLIAAGIAAGAQQITLPLWPGGPPEATAISGPERDIDDPAKDGLIAGRPIIRLTGVANPTLTLYKPATKPDGSPALNAPTPAVLVFPGGGYQILALDLEGTEVCDWLNSIGVTCVLVKYRVPLGAHYPEQPADLEDAQQAMRLTRLHAAEWGIDPHRIGALGFSAGGHLVAVLSNHADYKPGAAPGGSTSAAPEDTKISRIDARPDFAIILYPGYLAVDPKLKDLAPEVQPTANTPPTFLLQAEDDPVHEENALVYFQALKEANVPAELHVFAQGGHGYGLRPTQFPITHWPALAETWMHTIHMLDGEVARVPK